LIWRLSRTTISSAVQFSDHRGFERYQVVTAGEGLHLDFGEGSIDLSLPFAPVRYPGELSIVSRLERDEPVEVLNLMFDRSIAKGHMRVIREGQGVSCEPGTHLIWAPVSSVEVTINNGRHCIPSYGCLRFGCDQLTAIASRSPVILSSIYM
jgi:environmental stress-induced protein Ves